MRKILLEFSPHFLLLCLLDVSLMRCEAEHVLPLEIKHRATDAEDDQDNDDDRCDRGAADTLRLNGMMNQ